MKKFFKYLFIILINIILLFLLTEFVCYLKCIFSINEEYEGFFARIKKYEYKWNFYKNFDDKYEYIKLNRLRKPVGLNYKKKPILLMGCSFAYGYNLKENENLGYRLSELLKRPVYNRAFEWLWGVHTMLYQSRREDFYKEVPEPKYVIYVFITDHINRIAASAIDPVLRLPHLRYIYKNGKLEREKCACRYNLYMFKAYTLFRAQSVKENFQYKILNEYFIETKQEFDKHWKNYKFIILLYDEAEDLDYIMNKIDVDDLKKNGFIVVHTKDLIGRYLNKSGDRIEDKFHPSSYAWSLIAPKLADKIKELE